MAGIAKASAERVEGARKKRCKMAGIAKASAKIVEGARKKRCKVAEIVKAFAERVGKRRKIIRKEESEWKKYEKHLKQGKNNYYI